MAKPGPSIYPVGQTVLIATVPEVEPLVRSWREQFDPAAAGGVPAHVTILAPFLDRSAIDASAVAELQQIFSRHRSFSVEFQECRRFAGVLYLAPVPDSHFRALTEAVAARWPEAPPYGGQFEDVVPHLTVALGQEPMVFDRIEAALSRGLPIGANVSAVELLTFTGEHLDRGNLFQLGVALDSAGGARLPGR